jgi:hypothetical protein
MLTSFMRCFSTVLNSATILNLHYDSLMLFSTPLPMAIIPLPLLVSAILISLSSADVLASISVRFNDTHTFGYDGQWQAIPMRVSWPEQVVNLYPSGAFSSVILSSNVANFRKSYSGQTFAGESGIFDLSQADPAGNSSTQNYYFAGPDTNWAAPAFDGSWNGREPMSLNGRSRID